jgi:membrane-bound lytic murein transglycosylase B
MASDVIMMLNFQYRRATNCVRTAALALSVVACGNKPMPQTQATSPVVAFVEPPKPVEAAPALSPMPADLVIGTPEFVAWVAAFRIECAAKGISTAVFDTALKGVELNPSVVRLDREQLQGTTTYASYVGRRLTASLIAQGRSALATNADVIAKAEQTYGVPGAVMVGIWGNETSFGGDMGRSDVIRSLVTLAYEGRRAELFKNELFSVLSLLESKKMTRDQLVGSWAGAMGNTQFMPSSILSYGVDSDGNGQVDLRGSLPDVFGSLGNYLKLKGWQPSLGPSLGWGFQVKTPSSYDSVANAEVLPTSGCKRAFIKHSKLRPASVWKSEGFAPAKLSAAWPADEVPMALVQPDGPGGISFLTTQNYRVILDYNCSNYYALTVLGLADALR